jgi:hypothetical protein
MCCDIGLEIEKYKFAVYAKKTLENGDYLALRYGHCYLRKEHSPGVSHFSVHYYFTSDLYKTNNFTIYFTVELLKSNS